MNDPHVVALLYRVEHGESVDYSEAEPLVREEPAFRLEVKDNKVRFELKDHYASEEDARNAVEDYIRDWEFDACLEKGPDSFRLKFDRAKIIDRNPTLGACRLAAEVTATGYGSSTLTIGFRSYPSPPSDIRIDAAVQTMFDRYMNHLRRLELLPGMANFCLTMLEDMAERAKQGRESKRKAASRYFQIEMKVLQEIGRLSSTKGGPLGARKSEGVFHDLTNEESGFLRVAVKKMIRRAAEKAHSPGKIPAKISLPDLSPI